MDKALTWFIGIWIGLVVLLNIVGVIGLLIAAPTLWSGIVSVGETYSPFNLWAFGLNVVLLLPALGAYVWRDRRRQVEP